MGRVWFTVFAGDFLAVNTLWASSESSNVASLSLGWAEMTNTSSLTHAESGDPRSSVSSLDIIPSFSRFSLPGLREQK